MDVQFRSRKLRRCYEHGAGAIREWGPDVGRRYVQRVGLLLAVERVPDLFTIRSLDFHPLAGNRKGQHAIRLTGQLRLILTVEDAHTVTVEEVTDYHD